MYPLVNCCCLLLFFLNSILDPSVVCSTYTCRPGRGAGVNAVKDCDSVSSTTVRSATLLIVTVTRGVQVSYHGTTTTTTVAIIDVEIIMVLIHLPLHPPTPHQQTPEFPFRPPPRPPHQCPFLNGSICPSTANIFFDRGPTHWV